MTQKLDYLKETPSQTAGPYVHIGLAPGAVAKEYALDTAMHRETSGDVGHQGSLFEASAALSASRAFIFACLALRRASL